MKIKDVLLSAIIVVLVLIAWMLNNKANISKEEQTTEVDTEPQPLYGTVEYVRKVPTEEWIVGGIDFKPVDCSLDVEVQEFIYYLALGYNIDFNFVMAVIAHESDYRADIISSTNDYGLMQINKCNHEWLSEALGITDFLDPYQNVMAGVYMLHNLFEKYEDAPLVLMAYNMGESGAKRLWDKGIYETKYSRAIIQKLEGDGNE